MERHGILKSANCALLSFSYPFVKRTSIANITRETLVLNGEDLYSIFMKEAYRK